MYILKRALHKINEFDIYSSSFANNFFNDLGLCKKLKKARKKSG